MLLAVTAGNPPEKMKHCQWNVHNPTTSGLLRPARLKYLALKCISLIPLLSQRRKVNLKKKNSFHLIGLSHQMFFLSFFFMVEQLR